MMGAMVVGAMGGILNAPMRQMSYAMSVVSVTVYVFSPHLSCPVEHHFQSRK
jgi:hypothetical protein